MSRYIVIGSLFLVFIACGSDKIKKPDNLIPESKMVDIMVEITKFSSATSLKKAVLDANENIPTEYIYKKYNIDSLQFAKSNEYYAHDLDVTKSLYERIKIRLEEERDNLKKIQEKELKVKRTEDSIRNADKYRIKDSLKKLGKSKKPLKKIESFQQ